LEAVGTELKIGSSLKPNHHRLPKSVKRSEQYLYNNHELPIGVKFKVKLKPSVLDKEQLRVC